MYELTQNEVKRKMIVKSVCDDVQSHWSDVLVKNFARGELSLVVGRWSLVVGKIFRTIWELRAPANDYRPTTSDQRRCAAANLLDADRHL